MAAGRYSLTGAGAPALQKTPEPPPDHKTKPKNGKIKPFSARNIRAQDLYCAFNVALYALLIITTQTRGSWLTAWERVLPYTTEKQATDVPCVVFTSAPLIQWSQYVLFNHVLDEGKAPAPCAEDQRGNKPSMKRKSKTRDRVTIFCMLLLLCGDVQLNPGPVGALPADIQLHKNSTRAAHPSDTAFSMSQGNLAVNCLTNTRSSTN